MWAGGAKAKGERHFTAIGCGPSVPDMETILTFGDSNTHGTRPITDRAVYGRFGADVRWPTVAARALGWPLVEEGLPGRTTMFADPVMGDFMDGRVGLKMALRSHGPIDVLTIMLGTNDVKTMFGATPEAIAAGLAGLLAIAHSDDMQTRHGGFKTLVICPPPVIEQGAVVDVFFGGRAKSLALSPLYAALAAHWGAGFLDAGAHIGVSPVDGVHFDDKGHADLARAVAAAVLAL